MGGPGLEVGSPGVGAGGAGGGMEEPGRVACQPAMPVVARLPEWGLGVEGRTLLRRWLHVVLHPLRLETCASPSKVSTRQGQQGSRERRVGVEAVDTEPSLPPRGLRRPSLEELRTGKPQPLHLCTYLRAGPSHGLAADLPPSLLSGTSSWGGPCCSQPCVLLPQGLHQRQRRPK